MVELAGVVPLVVPASQGHLTDPLQGLIGLLPFVMASVEYAGRPLQHGLLPWLDLTGLDLVPGGQLGHRYLALIWETLVKHGCHFDLTLLVTR